MTSVGLELGVFYTAGRFICFSIVFERLWFCFVSKHFARYSLWKSIEIEETTGIILKAFVAFWWQNRNAVFKFEGNQRKENTIEEKIFRRFIVVQGNMWRILMGNNLFQISKKPMYFFCWNTRNSRIYEWIKWSLNSKNHGKIF